jgi:hypothetical protein
VVQEITQGWAGQGQEGSELVDHFEEIVERTGRRTFVINEWSESE